MNTVTISQKDTYKHLDLSHYEYIINELVKHNAAFGNKKRNTGKTDLIHKLALDVATSVSNIYNIIKDATIVVKNYNLSESVELTATAAFNKRSNNHKVPNNFKLHSTSDFINFVVAEMQSNKLSSVDEPINYLKLYCPHITNSLTAICTKTLYNYINAGYFLSSLLIYLEAS